MIFQVQKLLNSKFNSWKTSTHNNISHPYNWSGATDSFGVTGFEVTTTSGLSILQGTGELYSHPCIIYNDTIHIYKLSCDLKYNNATATNASIWIREFDESNNNVANYNWTPTLTSNYVNNILTIGGTGSSATVTLNTNTTFIQITFAGTDTTNYLWSCSKCELLGGTISPTFGKTTVGGSSIEHPFETKVGTRFKATKSGYHVIRLHAYVGSSGGGREFYGILYSDNAGSPDARLLTTYFNEKTLGPGFSSGWITIEFSDPTIDLVKDNYYWIAIKGVGGGFLMYYDVGTTNQSCWNNDPGYDGNPSDPFGSPTFEDKEYSMYYDIAEIGISLDRGFMLPLEQNETLLQKSGVSSSGDVSAPTSYGSPLKRFLLDTERMSKADYDRLYSFLNNTDISVNQYPFNYTDEDNNTYFGKIIDSRVALGADAYYNTFTSLTFMELPY
jgi:hypothetical protein